MVQPFRPTGHFTFPRRSLKRSPALAMIKTTHGLRYGGYRVACVASSSRRAITLRRVGERLRPSCRGAVASSRAKD